SGRPASRGRRRGASAPRSPAAPRSRRPRPAGRGPVAAAGDDAVELAAREPHPDGVAGRGGVGAGEDVAVADGDRVAAVEDGERAEGAEPAGEGGEAPAAGLDVAAR